MASDFYNNSVFWIEVGRIRPNPFQPRKEFDELALESLADSIRQYGVLQPLVVTRNEIERSDGGITVEYELVAGERRLRASKLAQLSQVPVLIRSTGDSDKMKLEIAIIENLQREDLNPIDRALAFKQLADSFNLKHIEIAKKVGKSREYVSNSLRLLALPDAIQAAVVGRRISEGHTRPILMLIDRPQQQQALYEEIMEKKLTVREAERIARGIAVDRARKQDLPPELASLERALTEHLGTRVQIETRAKGGKLHIDFFTEDDIKALLARIDGNKVAPPIQSAVPEETMPQEEEIREEVLQVLEGTVQNTEQFDITEEVAMPIPAATAIEDNTEELSPLMQFTCTPDVQTIENNSISCEIGVPQDSFEDIKDILLQEVTDGGVPESNMPTVKDIVAEVQQPMQVVQERQEAPKAMNDDDDDDLYSLRNFAI